MPIIKWRPAYDPFLDFERMFEGFGLPTAGGRGFVPALDVYQDNDNVIVEAPLPGINPENINISVENDVLTIEGTSEKKSEVDEKNYYRKEVRRGSFHRAVALPAAVAGEKASADYKDGVLKVIIPKEERAKPKQIKIASK